MAKVNSAIIKLTLRLNKTLSNGQHPIMLKVQFNGRKEKSTGYSCNKSDWDKEQEHIKNKKLPNYAAINKAIYDIKQEVVNRRMNFELRNQPYTVSMLLEEVNRDFSATSLVFKDLIKTYIEEKDSAPNTICSYQLMLSALSKFLKREDFIINELSETFCRKFAEWLHKKGLEDGSIRTILSKLAAIFNYAIDKDLIDAKLYPFRTFKYNKTYNISNKKQAITKQNMDAIHAYYYKLVYADYVDSPNESINFSYGETYFRNDALKKLQQRFTIEHTCALFLFGFLAQGLAMVDIAKLKESDIIQKDIECQDNKIIKCYIIKTKRGKTNVSVDIVIKQDDYAISIIEPYLRTAHLRDGYLFPILQDNSLSYHYDTYEKKSIALDTTSRVTNNNLKKIRVSVNEQITKYCQENSITIPELIPKGTTFYAMRHTFATTYIKENGNPLHLATMMGRSANNIFDYVKELTKYEDIMKERDKVYE